MHTMFMTTYISFTSLVVVCIIAAASAMSPDHSAMLLRFVADWIPQGPVVSDGHKSSRAGQPASPGTQYDIQCCLPPYHPPLTEGGDTEAVFLTPRNKLAYFMVKNIPDPSFSISCKRAFRKQSKIRSPLRVGTKPPSRKQTKALEIEKATEK